MANPIVHCLERLNLEDSNKVKQRAEQFQGQLSNLPTKLFDKGPNLKSVICIQLAYESLKHYDWDMKSGVQLAGCTASAYDSVLSNVRKQLNIQPIVTLDILAVALGSTTMLGPAKELWQDFSTSYQNQFTGAKRVNAQKELELPCWKGAIMFCCAKAFGDNLNKSKLHSLCACSTPELNKSIKLVQLTSAEKILELKDKSAKPTRTRRGRNKTQEEDGTEIKKKPGVTAGSKRKRKATASEVVATKPSMPKSGIASMIDHQDYQQTKRYNDYLLWKSALFHQLST